MKINDLKFPSGEFTHSDLAKHNGTTNQKVWGAYSEAREKKIIVDSGKKQGKATLWVLADSNQASAPVATVTPAATTDTTTPNIVVEVVKVETVEPEKPTHESLRPVTVSASTVETEDTDYKCPVCGSTMKSYNTDSGVMLFCPVNSLAVCKSTENPYGHGKNLKEAYAIACDKWKIEA